MKMKKAISILIALLMVMSLAACSGGQSDNSSDADSVAAQAEEQSAENADASTAEGKALIIFFSANNLNDVDAVSSATPITDGVSATQWFAEVIQSQTNADIEHIVPATDYPLEYNDCADYAKTETDSDARPAYNKLALDPADYDTIYIGYPMWWYTVPMVFETFFDDYDLSGKTIVPFNTHAGSRDGGTYSVIQEREPGATVLEGLAISGSSCGSDEARNEIVEWLEGLGL